jgi:hypothetical protein
VAFTSQANTLAMHPPPDTNGHSDVYLWDRLGGPMTRVSLGRHSFTDVEGDGPSGSPSVSADGQFVAFASTATTLGEADPDTEDVWVHDLFANTTDLVSVSTAGAAASDPADCSGGLGFRNDLPYIDDRPVTAPSISADGRFVAFASCATNIVEPDANGDDADVYVHDRVSWGTVRVNVTVDGDQVQLSNACVVNGVRADAGILPAIAPSGESVVFTSYASGLVAADEDRESCTDPKNPLAYRVDRERDVFIVARIPPAPTTTPSTAVPARDSRTSMPRR